MYKDFETAEQIWNDNIENSQGKDVVLHLVSLDDMLSVDVKIVYDGFVCGMVVKYPIDNFGSLKMHSKEYIINYLAQFKMRYG